MNLYNKIKLLCIFVFLAQTIAVQATHVMGSDITYVNTGGQNYKITVKIYRDCRGISLSTTNATISTNNGCSSGVTLTLTSVGVKNISSYCAGTTAPCTPSNTNATGKGIEEHTFEGTVDLSRNPYRNWASSGCCEVYFSWDLCCRNGAITTGQASRRFYTYSMLNICNIDSFASKANSSPLITSTPVAFICCNQPYYFNNGCKDTVEYDSLGYSLELPLGTSRTNTLAYTSPLTAKIPMTPFCPTAVVTCTPKPGLTTPEGFYLDSLTGDVIFTPSSCSEVGVIVVQATEYRRTASGTLLVVGVIRRDMQLIVESCPINKTPVISGPTDTSICLGQSICYDIVTTDANNDTLTLTWNKGIPKATFTIKNPSSANKTGEFCWKPDSNVTPNRDYYFSANVADNYCPIKATSSRSFKVRVTNKPDITIKPVTYIDSCQQNAIIGANGPASSSFRYTWQIPGGDTILRSGLDLRGTFNVRYALQGSYPVYLNVVDTSGFGCLLSDSTTVNLLCAVLPVELAYFNASFSDISNSEIYVNWITLAEQGIKSYLVQWSNNNRTFHTGDSIAPIGSNGSTKYYSTFKLPSKEKGNELYVRLMEHTLNGERNIISETITLDGNNLNNFIIYPVPSQTGTPITIKGLTRGAKRIIIFNQNGAVAFDNSLEVNNSILTIENLSLPEGMYTISIGEVKRKLVIIN